jgi:hypothetical protein
MQGHPSPSAKQGHLSADDVVTKGVNRDIGAFPATKDVYCKQCGFVCNLARDIRNIDQFAGETITSGTELSNGSFEDWTAGSPDHWTVSGTVTEETSSGYFDDSDDGVSSARITRSGSDISLSQAMATPSDFNSNTVIFRIRVKSSTNEVIRLRVDINSVSYYSSYNIAQQNFQELSCVVICPATVSSLTVYILADNANGTAYIDQAILARSGNPTTVSIQAGCPMCGSYNYY